MANHKLIPGNSGTFYIQFEGAGNNIPFSRSQFTAVFDPAVPNTMRLIPNFDTNRNVFNNTLFSQLTNSLTGLAFASFAELAEFAATYINLGGGAGAAGTATTLLFTIVAAPVGDDQKAPGATIQDDRMINGRFVSMEINEDRYIGANVDFSQTTGEIGLNPSVPTAFQDGDVVEITILV